MEILTKLQCFIAVKSWIFFGLHYFVSKYQFISKLLEEF